MQDFENHAHWSAVKDVCRCLKESGHEALLAGGCVRDLLMGREPNDFDIATSATPDEVSTLFPSALTVGKAFGVTILPFKEGFQLEIATFREDGAYVDGRRPSSVRFSSPEEDARRRDFTVNALFFDLDGRRVIDFVGGQEDIRQRVIRTVGDPESRFTEDKLRLFRALRFAAQLGFSIDPATFEAIRRMAPEIRVVSRERVRDELLKLLQAPRRTEGLELMVETGLLAALFPELATRLSREGRERWLAPFRALGASEANPALLLALFFHPEFSELKEPELKETGLRNLQNLRLENRTIDAIVFAHRALPSLQEPRKVRWGELALLLSHAHAKTAERLAEVLEKAEGHAGAMALQRRAFLEDVKKKSLSPDGQRPAPFVTGADLKAVGIEAGPEMGKILREALLLQLEGALPDRAGAEAWVRSLAPWLRQS